MERARPEEIRVYQNVIENLESLKHREGTTNSELNTLAQIQKNLAGLAANMAGFQPQGGNAFGSFGLGLTL